MGPFGVIDGEGFDGSKVPIAGRITASALSRPQNGKTLLFVGSAFGGIWRSADLGRTWEPKSDREESLAIGALVADKDGIIYAGTGEANVAFRDLVVTGDRLIAGAKGRGLLRSFDQGDSWDLVGGDVFADAAFSQIAVLEDRRLIAATTKGLFVSDDRGLTWKKQRLGHEDLSASTSVVVNTKRHNVAFAAVWGQGVFRSEDAGSPMPTWKPVRDGLPLSNLGRIQLAWSEDDPESVFALVSTSDHVLRGLYESGDGGRVWRAVDGVPDLLNGEGFFHMLFGAHPWDSNVIYLGGGGKRGTHGSSLYRGTRNGGRWNFAPVGSNLHTDFISVTFDITEPRRIFVSSGGGLWRSDDNGESWVSCNGGLAVTQTTHIAQHPHRTDVLLVGTQDNGTLRHDAETGWHHVDGGDGGYVAIDQDDPKFFYDEFSGYRIARSEKAGIDGSFVPSHPLIGKVSSSFFAPFDLNPANQSEIALAADRLYLSGDRGLSWKKIPFDFIGPEEFIRSLRYANERTIYLGTSTGSVFKLLRSGTGWTVRRIAVGEDFGESVPINAFGLLPNSNGVLVAMESTRDAPLWKIEELPGSQTETLTNISGDGQKSRLSGPAYSVFSDGSFIYAGVRQGVWYSPDGGSSWYPAGNGLPNVPVFDIQKHPLRPLLRASTFGRGVWQLTLAD